MVLGKEMRTCDLDDKTIELILKLDKCGLTPLEISQEVGISYQQCVYIIWNYDY